MIAALFLAFPLAFAAGMTLGHLLLAKGAKGYVNRVRERALRTPYQWE
jgi:hypothetical protein